MVRLLNPVCILAVAYMHAFAFCVHAHIGLALLVFSLLALLVSSLWLEHI